MYRMVEWAGTFAGSSQRFLGFLANRKCGLVSVSLANLHYLCELPIRDDIKHTADNH